MDGRGTHVLVHSKGAPGSSIKQPWGAATGLAFAALKRKHVPIAVRLPTALRRGSTRLTLPPKQFMACVKRAQACRNLLSGFSSLLQGTALWEQCLKGSSRARGAERQVQACRGRRS